MVGERALEPALLALGRAEVDHPRIDPVLVQDRDRAAAPGHVVDVGRQHQRRDEHDRRRALVGPWVVATKLEHALLGRHLVGRRLVVGGQPAEASDLERVLCDRAYAADRGGDRLRHAGHRRPCCRKRSPGASANPRSGYCQPALPVELSVRDARREDVALIFGWVVELADYERARDQVTRHALRCSRRRCSDRRRPAEALIAEVRSDPDGPWEPAGFALFYKTFSTWEGRPGIWLEDLYVPPAHRRVRRRWRAPVPPRQDHRRRGGSRGWSGRRSTGTSQR